QDLLWLARRTGLLSDFLMPARAILQTAFCRIPRASLQARSHLLYPLLLPTGNEQKEVTSEGLSVNKITLDLLSADMICFACPQTRDIAYGHWWCDLGCKCSRPHAGGDSR